MKTLTAEQEIEFHRDYREGLVTGDEFFEQYKRLIQTYLRGRHVQFSYYADAFQDCCICLLKCADTWEPKKGRFTTHLVAQLRGITTSYYRKRKKDLREVSIDEAFPENDNEYGQSNYSRIQLAAEESKELISFEFNLKRAVDSLDEREKKIIFLYFFKDVELYNVAKLLGIPRGSITWHYQRALKKMRNAYEGKEEVKVETKKVKFTVDIDLSDI